MLMRRRLADKGGLDSTDSWLSSHAQHLATMESQPFQVLSRILERLPPPGAARWTARVAVTSRRDGAND